MINPVNISEQNCVFSYVDTKHDFKTDDIANKVIGNAPATKVTPAGINCSNIMNANLKAHNENSIFKYLQCKITNVGTHAEKAKILNFDDIKSRVRSYGNINGPGNIAILSLTCNSILNNNQHRYDIHNHRKDTYVTGPEYNNINYEGIPVMIKLGLHKLITHTNGRINIVYDATSGTAFKRCFQSNINPIISYSNKFRQYFNTNTKCFNRIRDSYTSSYKSSNGDVDDEMNALVTIIGHVPPIDTSITTQLLYEKTMYHSHITMHYLAYPKISADPAIKPKRNSKSWLFNNNNPNQILAYEKTHNIQNNIIPYTNATEESRKSFFSNINGVLSYTTPTAADLDVEVNLRLNVHPVVNISDISSKSEISNVLTKLDPYTKNSALYLQFKKMGDQNQALFILNLPLPTAPAGRLLNSRNTFLLTNDRVLLAYCLANGISCGFTIGSTSSVGDANKSMVITFIKKL